MKKTKNLMYPVTIVIFGITGDLARRKLIPDLWNLFISGNLPEKFSIIGFARREWSDDDLKKYAEDILKEKNSGTLTVGIKDFVANFSYVSGDLGKEEFYKALADKLLEIDKKSGVCRAKLFHLSVPPEMYETIFEQIGALRDVGQNHMLQMLAFIAMEGPGVFEAEAMRQSRAKVLSEFRLIGKKEIEKFVKRGQYQGYLEEPSVSLDSKTETYFRVEAHIENERWKGVPFYLESGKRLGKSAVEIEVVFRKKDSFLCPPNAGHISQNTIVFRIQPDEGIDISFWTKRPGFEMKLDPKTLSFSREKSGDAKKAPDAYERIIFDCIAGDQTLFAGAEEVAASWKFIAPIIENWDSLPLLKYKQDWIPKKMD